MELGGLEGYRLRTERTYTASEIADRLSALRGWTYADGFLQRTFRGENFKSILIIVTTVGHLCEAAWHHPEMVVGYNTVLVKLCTHSAGGVTDKDFALARKIEEVIAWRPGADSPLTGTPADPRHAYIRYD